MRFSTMLLATTAVVATVPAYAHAIANDRPATAADPDAGTSADQVQTGARDERNQSDIVVVGKSYGREVGKTVTPLKDVANTVTVIERDQIEA